MTLSSLVDPAHASDSGGVAGRVGYDYQAHVAAAFVLRMIANPALLQVECETADDVTLRWERDGHAQTEYVQVKTTEAEAKWGIGEITARDGSRQGTSIMEKSLACDAYPDAPLFRFVMRAARNILIDRGRRVANVQIDDLHEAELPIDSGATPLEALDMSERLKLCQRALEAMPPLRREVFVRRRAGEETYEAIARDLRLSVEAVQKHYSRAAQTLRRTAEGRHVD